MSCNSTELPSLIPVSLAHPSTRKMLAFLCLALLSLLALVQPSAMSITFKVAKHDANPLRSQRTDAMSAEQVLAHVWQSSDAGCKGAVGGVHVPLNWSHLMH
jgi:hypothetical protein